MYGHTFLRLLRLEYRHTNQPELKSHAMWFSKQKFMVLTLAASSVAAITSAQWRGGRGRGMPDRSEYPTWEIEQGFKSDVFTFVRVEYDSGYSGRGGRWRG